MKNKTMKNLIILLITIIPLIVNGQCPTTSDLTSTYGHNNGQDGVMFDVVSNGLNAIEINCIGSNWDPGGNINYEVYIKDGSCIGFANNSAAWSLHSAGSVVSTGNGNTTLITLDSIIGIECSNTVGIYLTNTGGSNPNANYTNGTSLGQVYSSNTDISILQGYGKSYPFGSTYGPRVFNGTIHYNTVGCGALPIELLNFEGECSMLKWSTATENNNDYFIVESSLNGGDWTEVDRVDGAGTTLTPQTYTLNLNPTNRLKYYRLTQVDFDGQSEVFKTISVSCNKPLEIEGVYDMMGKKVANDLNGNFQHGIYLIKYSNEDVERIYL